MSDQVSKVTNSR